MSQQWGAIPPQQQQPKRKRHLGRNIALAIVGLFVLGGVIGSIGGSDQPATIAAQTTTTALAPTAVDKTPAQTTAPPATRAPATTRPKPAAPKLTTSQEQAVGTARDYLGTSHFSRSGLIEQLEFEQYSKADATFAVNYLHMDWKEQAVGTAQDYLDTSHFSRGGLIGQLKFEGYTTAEAVYAVDHVGL